MKTHFDTSLGVVLIDVVVRGPRTSQQIVCVLDTGSMITGINESVLTQLGFDLRRPVDWTEIGTASDVRPAGIFELNSIQALGLTRRRFPVVAHRLPQQVIAEGLLGLDFIRDCRLLIDMRDGFMELTE